MKKCEGCGAMQPDETKFCDVCGASLEEVSKTVTLTLMQAVIAYQAGDNDAFQTIYDETEKYIYASILKVVGSYVNAQAMIEDIMKATYMEIGRSLGQLERPETFVEWANKVATRNCFAFLNANQPNPYWYDLPYGMADQQVGEYILPNTIEQDVAVQNSVRMIMEQQFTSMEKFCVVSHYYNGIEIEELSQSIGVPSQAIVRNLNSAKTKLCRTLMATEREKSTGMSDLSPWLVTLFKQDVDNITVPRRTHEMIKNAIAGVILGMPGALTSGVVLTGAVQATGSIAVNSALSGTGLSSIAGAMGGAAMGGAATGGTMMGAAANTGAGIATGSAAGVNTVGVGSTLGTGATGAASASGVISTGAATSTSGVVSTGVAAGTGAVSGTTGVASVTIVDTLGTGAGTAAGGAAAAGGSASAGIFSTIGAKIAVCVVGAAIATGGGIAIHHAVTSNDRDELVVEQMPEDNRLDENLYRVVCDYDRVTYVYEGDSLFAGLSIEGTKYNELASSVAAAMNRYRDKVEAKIPEQEEWAHQFGYDSPEYSVNFKVARADENIFSTIVLEEWNTYTDVTIWEPFVTIDAKTGDILDLNDVCEVSELKNYTLNHIDGYLADIEVEYGYSGGDPKQIKEHLEQSWDQYGYKWFLAADGIGIFISSGVPVEGGQWTMIIPYEDLNSFKEKYLPKGAISSDLTCDIGLTVMPQSFDFDTDGDGQRERYGEDGRYRAYHSGHGSYFVRNASGQCFFVVPNQDGDKDQGTRIYLVTDGVEQEVTNAKALDLNICNIAGDVAYCRDFTTNTYGYYQITDKGLLPWNIDLMMHKYELVEDSVSWEEAKTLAEKRGGHLVTITSEDEQIYVETIANGTCCWIGAYCDEDHKNWQWVTGEEWKYTNWAEGEPNNSDNVASNERYASMWPCEWNDLANESVEQSGYIIEWD